MKTCSSKKKIEYITVTGLVGKRGWTRSMANKLLTKIKFKEVNNPHYKCADYMKLYDLKDIQRIEKTKKFLELKEKADKRKISAQKGLETKKANLKKKEDETLKLVDDFSIEVERISIEELRNKTLSSKQEWYDMHPKIIKTYIGDDEEEILPFSEDYISSYDDYIYTEIERNAYNAPEEVIRRWMVSYIRHNLTNYEKELEKLSNRHGQWSAYSKYKYILSKEMKRVYPELEGEIDKYMVEVQDSDNK